MLRSLLLLCLLAPLAARAAGPVFVAPLDGSQAIGPMLLEIQADATGVDRVDFYVDGNLVGAARSAPYRIYYDFGSSLEARTVSARVWRGGFTTSESVEVTTAGVTANDTLHVDLVEVPLHLRSRQAAKASDLRVRENGVEQEVRELTAQRPAGHFAFVVDRSLSMGDGKLDAALSAVAAALPQLRPGDTASLVLFNHHVANAVAINAGDDLAARAATAPPSGGTSLRDAVASAASDDRTWAIVITDGGDRNSELSDEEALRKVSGTKTVVNAVVLGSSHARFLDRAAGNTGGAVVTASAATVASRIAALIADINSRHLLVYQSHGTARGWRRVEVSAARRGVAVESARRGYFAAP